ncbi:MAG: polysaccharide biosynthesis/export family protein [Phycisphaerae bacterium]|nr:polysaccharide biosynthesis/export family protein [Phycisphaerae bacterium]MDW8261601.1 polysaccharide biosynthesis/export family protein [Phycisphaerales bacterium]
MRSLGSIQWLRKLSVGAVAVAGTLTLGGCLEKGFLDQTELGAFNKDPLVVPILQNLNTGIEEPADIFGQAEEPTAEDLVAEIADYTISPNDLVSVQISDLRGIGIDDGRQARVTDTGKITLPNLGQFTIAGMTEAQAEEAVAKAYRDAQIIQNANVAVTVLEARGRTFSIVGAVGRAGQYAILKSDFRLLDAFVASADFDVTRGTRGYDYVYVIRKKTPGEGTRAPQPAEEAPVDVLKPRSQATPSEDFRQAAFLRTQPVETPPAEVPAETPGTPDAPPTQPAEPGEGRYIIVDGKPVLVGGGPVVEPPAETPTVQPDAPPAGAPAAPPADATPFEFNAPREPEDVRVIRIPMVKLVQGNLRYNIVIRPNDLIFVPNPLEGVYYMGGHVQRPGVYVLGGGNKVSLIDAIIAAGGLDQVAVPWRTQVIRRIQGEDKQIFATVDLTKIFNGEEPDLYLKKDDKIIVGTQFWAPFLASIRNGFRVTYGFGFLYDRNYAADENNQR